ncbi:MAG TPA: hypothetical protein PLF13_03975 [candidate division Zixibacteria bacterium]|nr:hypothetical protein [candidate division Zixibacteria bacterium]
MISKQHHSLTNRLFRFLVGLAALTLFYVWIMSGVTPPGICGSVIRHNRAANIDASPLFYSDVEHMNSLERGVEALRRAAARRSDTDRQMN